MTKSFEVAIAIILLLCFIFFLFENINQDYRSQPIPEDLKNTIISNAENNEFRELIVNDDVNHIYELLYPQLDYSFNVTICNGIDTSCITKTLSGFTKKKEFIYFFGEYNKTLHILLN